MRLPKFGIRLLLQIFLLITIAILIFPIIDAFQAARSSLVQKSHRALSRRPVKDLWFAKNGTIFLLESDGDDEFFLTNLSVNKKDALTIERLDLSRLRRREGLGSGGELVPFAFSRDGQKISWMTEGMICFHPVEAFNGLSCESSLSVPDWEKVESIAFVGDSVDVVFICYADGLVRLFDASRILRQNHYGSRLSGPGFLSAQGNVVLSMPVDGAVTCLEMTYEDRVPYLKQFAPNVSNVVVTAAAAKSCNEIFIGTEDGAVFPVHKVLGPLSDIEFLDGKVTSLSLNGEEIVAAGEFKGIYQLKKGTPKRVVVESVAGVRSLDAREGFILYRTSSVSGLVELGPNWRPVLPPLFGALGALLAFIYSLVTQRAGK